MKKKKISKKANLVVCAVAFIIMIVYLVFVDSIDNVVAALSKINKGALILCVVFMIGSCLPAIRFLPSLSDTTSLATIFNKKALCRSCLSDL